MSLAGAARSLVALASRRQCKPSAASAAALPVKPLPNRPFGTARSEAAREAAERAVPNGAYISLSRAHGLLIWPTRSFSPPLMSDSARLSLCLLPASPVLTFEF